MKNIFKISLLAIILAVSAVSCEMDRFPFDKIEQSQAFQSVDDALALRNGFYSGLRGRLHGLYTYATDIQSDIFNASLDYGNRNGALHDWVNLLADNYQIRDTWAGYYGALVNINNFLERVDEIPVEDQDEQDLIDQFKGEAHFIRAFYYHNLVKRFAKDYDPATAATDLGVPLILTFDVTLLPERATVEVIYQQILSDLSDARTFLADIDGYADADRITIDAVTALDARVALDMHNWSGAITAANNLMNSTAYSLITNQNQFTAMWVDDVSTETIFMYPLSAPNELGNTMDLYLRYRPDDGYYAPDWVPEQWVVDQYDVNDIRLEAYLDQKDLYIQGSVYPGIYCLNKYPGNPTLWTGANSNYRNMPKVFRLAEMYLIAAEAGAQNAATEAAALDALNDLRTARGLTALVGVTGTALMDEVKAERTRELLGEGFRIDDLKRWNMGFSRTAPQNADLIQTGANFDQKVVAAGDDKFVWAIPQRDVTTNPNIADQQNPGW